MLTNDLMHGQYGSAIYDKTAPVKQTTFQLDTNNIEVLAVGLSSVVVTSFYKHQQ